MVCGCDGSVYVLCIVVGCGGYYYFGGGVDYFDVLVGVGFVEFVIDEIVVVVL